MFALFCFFLSVLASPFRSKSRLEAENAVLRHQLIVLRFKVPGRVRLTNNDRRFLIQLYRWFPSILQCRTCDARAMASAGFRFFGTHSTHFDSFRDPLKSGCHPRTTSVITQPLRAFLRRTLWAARAGREVDRHFAPRPTIA